MLHRAGAVGAQKLQSKPSQRGKRDRKDKGKEERWERYCVKMLWGAAVVLWGGSLELLWRFNIAVGGRCETSDRENANSSC